MISKSWTYFQRMKSIVYLIICIEYTQICSNLADDSSISCTEHNNDVHVTLACTTTDNPSQSHTFYYHDEDKYTQLQIVILQGHQFQFGQTNAFRNSVRLQIISITCSDQQSLDESLDPSSWCLTQNLTTPNLQNQLDTFKATLFNLTYLRQLEIIGPSFNSKEHMWHLPADLEELHIGYCRYTEYNLRNLRHLKFVDFSHNRLTKLPHLHYPLHSLVELRLDGNPLNEVTTNDIAKLCSLERLNLENTSFSKADRYCECERLRMWLGNLTEWMTNEHFTSFEAEGISNCNNDRKINCKPEEIALDEAIKLREDCIFHQSSNRASMWWWWMPILFCLLMILFLLIAYGIGTFEVKTLSFIPPPEPSTTELPKPELSSASSKPTDT